MSLLTFKTQNTSPIDIHYPVSVGSRTGLPKLFAAAVVNEQFCQTLLQRPEEALEHGYLGQTFTLTDQERSIIQSIRADTLPDLAKKVNRALKNI